MAATIGRIQGHGAAAVVAERSTDEPIPPADDAGNVAAANVRLIVWCAEQVTPEAAPAAWCCGRFTKPIPGLQSDGDQGQRS